MWKGGGGPGKGKVAESGSGTDLEPDAFGSTIRMSPLWSNGVVRVSGTDDSLTSMSMSSSSIGNFGESAGETEQVVGRGPGVMSLWSVRAVDVDPVEEGF